VSGYQPGEPQDCENDSGNNKKHIHGIVLRW
jgi:hypothetical protein